MSRLAPWRRVLLATAWLAAGCSGPASGARGTVDASPAAWHVVLQGLKPVFLCVWGTAQNSVFAAGGSRGNGFPSTILHYDGRGWKDLGPGGMQTFWWAHGTSDTDVWIVGESGRITHWDGSAFTEYASGTAATLYGVWAAAPDDVWAVGGTPEGGTAQPNDIVLHFDGTSWSPSPVPQALGRTFFKVWGASADDVYVVGEAGTIWHRASGAWSMEPSPSTATLTTVSGCGPNDVYAVGGRDVLQSDGTTWRRLDISAALTNNVNGVACGSPGNVVIVGSGGLKQRLAQGVWTDESTVEPYSELHSAWADPTGAYWTAGGDYLTDPSPGVSRAGVVAYYGANIPSSTMEP